MRVVARWETKGGKRWIQLEYHKGCYQYSCDNGGGVLPKHNSDKSAIAYMEEPWDRFGAGPVTLLQMDFPSVRKVYP
jgi:hypothetical protein